MYMFMLVLFFAALQPALYKNNLVSLQVPSESEADIVLYSAATCKEFCAIA